MSCDDRSTLREKPFHFRARAQIEAFLKALGDKEKAEGSFLFQGARVVLVRLADVSAAEVISLVRKEEAAE